MLNGRGMLDFLMSNMAPTLLQASQAQHMQPPMAGFGGGQNPTAAMNAGVLQKGMQGLFEMFKEDEEEKEREKRREERRARRAARSERRDGRPEGSTSVFIPYDPTSTAPGMEFGDQRSANKLLDELLKARGEKGFDPFHMDPAVPQGPMMPPGGEPWSPPPSISGLNPRSGFPDFRPQTPDSTPYDPIEVFKRNMSAGQGGVPAIPAPMMPDGGGNPLEAIQGKIREALDSARGQQQQSNTGEFPNVLMPQGVSEGGGLDSVADKVKQWWTTPGNTSGEPSMLEDAFKKAYDFWTKGEKPFPSPAAAPAGVPTAAPAAPAVGPMTDMGGSAPPAPRPMGGMPAPAPAAPGPAPAPMAPSPSGLDNVNTGAYEDDMRLGATQGGPQDYPTFTPSQVPVDQNSTADGLLAKLKDPDFLRKVQRFGADLMAGSTARPGSKIGPSLMDAVSTASNTSLDREAGLRAKTTERNDKLRKEALDRNIDMQKIKGDQALKKATLELDQRVKQVQTEVQRGRLDAAQERNRLTQIKNAQDAIDELRKSTDYMIASPQQQQKMMDETLARHGLAPKNSGPKNADKAKAAETIRQQYKNGDLSREEAKAKLEALMK